MLDVELLIILWCSPTSVSLAGNTDRGLSWRTCRTGQRNTETVGGEWRERERETERVWRERERQSERRMN